MKHHLFLRMISAAAALSVSLGSAAVFPQSPLTAGAAEDMHIEDFRLSDITMLDEYCTNAFSKEVEYLLSFDTNKLLAGFRENAGLNTYGATRYGGWENTNIAGHAVGHYLTAIAQAYQSPAVSEKDRNDLSKRMTDMVNALLECQKNSKGKPGLIWAASHPSGTSVEVQFDNIEQGKSNIINEAWVPWYTMHKILAGIIDIYHATGDENAKTLASNLGDWVYNRCKTWDSNKHRTVLSIEYGGMNDCLYDLYMITGKAEHAEAAHFFDETNLHEAVLKGGANVLNGKHANTTIPKFLGALKRYIALDGRTLNGETVDASKYLQYAEAFWDMVTTHHTYITGGNSEWEHFGMDDVLDKERTNCNCETCNSYNMLKLSRELYKITGDSKYMDFYEETYYNSILSSQNPETGMTTYFQPMATGYFKVYSSPFDHFWCCTGSGMESFTKLGDTIYMHRDDTLYVNLYQSSLLNWEDNGMKITQNSTIPEGDTADFTIEGSGHADIRFRIPDWKAGNVTVKLNGEKYAYKTVDGYAQVESDFSSGDRITVTIPETVRGYALPDKNSVYGFKYGPVVLSAELGKQDMATGSTGMWVTIPKEAISPDQNITITENGVSVAEFMSELDEYLVRDGDSMRFRLEGTNADLTFTPHYRQYQQRYGIYWNFISNGSSTGERPPRARETVIDTVQPGYGQYENDNLHNMTEKDSQGITDDSTYRYAKPGGYFSYRMAVDPEAPYTTLTVTLRKADNGKTLRIVAGDTILYAGTLDYSGRKDTYDKKLIIPADVLEECVQHITADGEEHDVIDITFSADNDEESAKVCDFIYTKAVKPLYEYDESIAYFVDCGDHDTYTLSGQDRLGSLNSVTEQVYGEDPVTGTVWGLIDDTTDQYNGSSKSSGIYTANTWCDEYNTEDGRDKTASYRYTKNQYENGIDRNIRYGFTLQSGRYSVEMCFSDPWNCSANPSVYSGYGTDSQKAVAENCAADGKTVSKGEVTVGKDSQLTLDIVSEDKAININYIIIRPIEVDPLPKVSAPVTGGMKADANCDGKVNVADAVAILQYIANQTRYPLSAEGLINADVDGEAGITGGDAVIIQKIDAGIVTAEELS